MRQVDFLEGSIVALLTPMSLDEQVDYESFERLVEMHVDAGTSAIVVASTTGEGPTLSHEEHVYLYRRAVHQAQDRIPVIAGVGSPSTHIACELAREAEHERVDAVLCVTPYCNQPNAFGLNHHFTTVADAVDIPVILYDVPHRTGVRIPDEVVVALSHHPNVAGLKDATGDVGRAARLLTTVAPGFRLLSGDDSTALEFMATGGKGVISVAANVAASAIRSLCDAILRGDLEQASVIDDSLRPLYDLLGSDTNPVPAKWLAHKLGLMQDVLRAPLAIPSALAQMLETSVAFEAAQSLLTRCEVAHGIEGVPRRVVESPRLSRQISDFLIGLRRESKST